MPPFFLKWSVNRDQGRWRASPVSKSRPGIPGDSENSEEGISNLEASEALTVLEIHGKKQLAPRLQRS